MTPPPVPAPADLEQVDHLYGPLIRSTINKTSDRKSPLAPDELDDLTQHVYLKMLERNFLARCTAYLTAHPDKSFIQSLITFTRNLTINYFRDRQRHTARYPLYEDLTKHQFVEDRHGVDTLHALHIEGASTPSHENRILARQYLGEIAGFLLEEPDMLTIIEAALRAGGSLISSDVNLRRRGKPLHETTARRYIRRFKARVREVAA